MGKSYNFDINSYNTDELLELLKITKSQLSDVRRLRPLPSEPIIMASLSISATLRILS